ncbi:hypothetical protein ACLKA6_007064 [Drosophila palustris]
MFATLPPCPDSCRFHAEDVQSSFSTAAKEATAAVERRLDSTTRLALISSKWTARQLELDKDNEHIGPRNSSEYLEDRAGQKQDQGLPPLFPTQCKQPAMISPKFNYPSFYLKRSGAVKNLAEPFHVLMNYVAANGAQMKSKLQMGIQMTDLWQGREQFDAQC